MGTVATILVAGPASAADLAVKAPLQAPAFMASPWDGPYIGGNVGFGSTDFSATASIFGASATDHVTGSGVVGGVQRGYNKQFGTFVLGLETDFDATSISNTTDRVDTKLPWFGTVRAGFLLTPALLFYGTGGVAYGHAEISEPGASITVPGVGWAAGAGVQYAFTPQWSIGVEYLHVELDARLKARARAGCGLTGLKRFEARPKRAAWEDFAGRKKRRNIFSVARSDKAHPLPDGVWPRFAHAGGRSRLGRGGSGSYAKCTRQAGTLCDLMNGPRYLLSDLF